MTRDGMEGPFERPVETPTDIWRHAHSHTFPNGNRHSHVHQAGIGHPDLLTEAHDPLDCFYCVDCEPWRAQRAAIRTAIEEASR